VIFGQDRDELRRMYRESWRKTQCGELLSPLQAQIARVIEEHPEYQSLIDSSSSDTSFTSGQDQGNPYLHMGLHLALREQIATDRPSGVRGVFERLAAGSGDAHAAEHAMIECLAESLWEAQRDHAMPDEMRYLERLNRLARQP
jgi:hypothetical protein